MDRIGETARILRDLLEHEPRYRRHWQQHVVRSRSDEPSSAAVAKVLALYLWDSGQRDDTDVGLARKLRDRVRRALSGEQLSGETLTWFIEAFGMPESDGLRLWSQYSGEVSTPEGGIAFTLRTTRAMARPQRHRTVALFERYLVSAQRRIVRRHTLHVISALEDGIDSYFFNHEPAAAWIEVIAGGQLGARHDYGDGLVGHAIILDKPLQVACTASLEYLTHFDPSKPAVTEVRRPVYGRAQNVDVAVQYSEVRPSVVSFAVWDDHLLGRPVMTQPAVIDAFGSTHRFLPYAERTVVGFQWGWPEAGR